MPLEVPRATAGGRIPRQPIGAFVVHSLESHNVSPDWDELNPDDPEEDISEDDTRCDFDPM